MGSALLHFCLRLPPFLPTSGRWCPNKIPLCFQVDFLASVLSTSLEQSFINQHQCAPGHVFQRESPPGPTLAARSCSAPSFPRLYWEGAPSARSGHRHLRVLWEWPALQSFLIASSDVYCPFSFVTAPYFAALVSLSGCILANKSGGAGICRCAGPKEMTVKLWLMPVLAVTAEVGKALGRKTSGEKAGNEKASTRRQVWITKTCQ